MTPMEHFEWIGRDKMALLTDFYQLTMIGGYHEAEMHHPVCFEYFFRSLPPDTGYCISAGIEDVVNYLEYLRFTPNDLRYLEKHFGARPNILKYFEKFEFTGSVQAVPEGTPVFPHTPIIQVTAPLPEAQLVESFILNAMNYPTLVATKAARICEAAEGEPVLEFGLRRAQGPDGSLTGSRAAIIGGCVATSNVLAGKNYELTVKGTMAHSWVMAFPNELSAFRKYVEIYPDNPILLVDTYNTVKSGLPNAITVFKEMKEKGTLERAAIRLDSGDLAKLSKIAYSMLTEAGFPDPLIVASSDLDEYLIADLKRQGAKINAWGVGTNLITSRDCPALGGVYKLVSSYNSHEKTWEPKIKLSSNPAKITTPGRKEIYRLYDKDGMALGDVLVNADEYTPPKPFRPDVEFVDATNLGHTIRFETVAYSVPLLETFFQEGGVPNTIFEDHLMPEPEEIRDKVRNEWLPQFSPEYHRLRNPERYPVVLSPELAELKKRLMRM